MHRTCVQCFLFSHRCLPPPTRMSHFPVTQHPLSHLAPTRDGLSTPLLVAAFRSVIHHMCNATFHGAAQWVAANSWALPCQELTTCHDAKALRAWQAARVARSVFSRFSLSPGFLCMIHDCPGICTGLVCPLCKGAHGEQRCAG